MGLFGKKKVNSTQGNRPGNQFSVKQSALEIVSDCDDSISTEKRKIICSEIIAHYCDSSDPLDWLAVAIANKYLGASHRKQAIRYYEMYLSDPVRIPNKSELQWVIESWSIRSDLATLYESEYEFDKAIAMLKECITLDEKKVQLLGYGFNPANYTRIATIVMKRDGTASAIEYYKKLKKSKVYKLDREWFDEKYREMKEKHERGYVYRARKAKGTF